MVEMTCRLISYEELSLLASLQLNGSDQRRLE